MGHEKIIQLEGIVEQIDFEQYDAEDMDLGDDGYRLLVLIKADDGLLYSTFIERAGDEDFAAVKHLAQIYDTLNKGMRVRVSVQKHGNDEDMPLFKVRRGYQILEKKDKK